MPIYRLLQVGLPRTQFVHTVDKSFRFTSEDGCAIDMTLHRIESLGPDKPGFEPNFQSSDILAGTVGGALLLLFTVVAFLAWRVLFVLPMRQPLYKVAVDY